MQLSSVPTLQKWYDNIQENSIQTVLICLDGPRGTVSVLWPENYAKYLKSEFPSLNLKLSLFKHWLLQSKNLSEIICANKILFRTCLCKTNP